MTRRWGDGRTVGASHAVWAAADAAGAAGALRSLKLALDAGPVHLDDLHAALHAVLFRVVPNWSPRFTAAEREELVEGVLRAGGPAATLQCFVSLLSAGSPGPGDRAGGGRGVGELQAHAAVATAVGARFGPPAGDGVRAILRELLAGGPPAAGGGAAVQAAKNLASVSDRYAASVEGPAAAAAFMPYVASEAFGFVDANGAACVGTGVMDFLLAFLHSVCFRGHVALVGPAFARHLRGADGGALAVWRSFFEQCSSTQVLEKLWAMALTDWASALSEEGAAARLAELFGGGLPDNPALRYVLAESLLLNGDLPQDGFRALARFLVEQGHTSVGALVRDVAEGWEREHLLEAHSRRLERFLTVSLEWCLQWAARGREGGAAVFSQSILRGVNLRLGHPRSAAFRHGIRVAKALSLAVDPGKPFVYEDMSSSDEGEDDGAEGGAGRADEAAALPAAEDPAKGAAEPPTQKRMQDPYETGLGPADPPGADSNGGGSDSADSDDESETSLEAYDMSEDQEGDGPFEHSGLRSCMKALRAEDADPELLVKNLNNLDELLRAASSAEYDFFAPELCDTLLRLGRARDEETERRADALRGDLLANVVRAAPKAACVKFTKAFMSSSLNVGHGFVIVDALVDASKRLARSAGAGPPDAGASVPERRGPKTQVFAPTSLKAKAVPVRNRFPDHALHLVHPLLRALSREASVVRQNALLMAKAVLALGELAELCRFAPVLAEVAATVLERVLADDLWGHRDTFVRKTVLATTHTVAALVPAGVVAAGLQHRACIEGRLLRLLTSAQERCLRAAEAEPDAECKKLGAAVVGVVARTSAEAQARALAEGSSRMSQRLQDLADFEVVLPGRGAQ